MKILVLAGGNSPEREVSRRSAEAVVRALHDTGAQILEQDPVNGLAILDELGPQDEVFPILHGIGGEDGIIQSELEKRGLRYLGTNSQNSRTCFDKHMTRQALQKASLPIAKGELVTRASYAKSTFLNNPYVVKSVNGGSSLGTAIVREPRQLTSQELDQVFAYSKEAVIEELVNGIEITVPILDNSALPIIEIQPPDTEDFDYENKYNGKTRELCPPASVDATLQKKAQNLAEKAHKALGARHLSRVDMIVRPNGDIIILEINTIPGMTDQSLYPKSAQVAGISFPELVKKFVGFVERDYKLQRG